MKKRKEKKRHLRQEIKQPMKERKENRKETEQGGVGVTRDNLHGNFYRHGRRGNIRQTRLRSESG